MRPSAPLINVTVANEQEEYNHPQHVHRNVGHKVQPLVILHGPREHVQPKRDDHRNEDQHRQPKALVVELGVGADGVLRLVDNFVDLQLSLHQQNHVHHHQQRHRQEEVQQIGGLIFVA